VKILVLNSGSSSLKFQVIDTSAEKIASTQDQLLAKGEVEKIGSSESLLSFGVPGEPEKRFSQPIPDHNEAIAAAFEWLKGVHEIEAAGHRIVHGGEFFHQSARMDDDAVRKIESCISLAPLHNPHNLKGYYAVRRLLPDLPQVAVFDTAFHHGLPMKARLYAIPYVHYTRDKIRRYGFHGTSHRYVAYRFAQTHGQTSAEYKIISCHLGNGCSVCAVDHGKSIDTSMGYTPLEGLMMGTRSGDIDPGAVLHLVGKTELGLQELEVLLNKHSGLLGVSGISNDMRELLKESDKGNDRARLAVEMFCYRVRKYIGSYLAALEGADALVFTGGIGENAAPVRQGICGGLSALGVQLDDALNVSASGVEAEISAPDSPTKIWVIPTNEELVIARDTLRVIQGLPLP
jgi:acetate kinase